MDPKTLMDLFFFSTIPEPFLYSMFAFTGHWGIETYDLGIGGIVKDTTIRALVVVKWSAWSLSTLMMLVQIPLKPTILL